jgi:hypothetical protein
MITCTAKVIHWILYRYTACTTFDRKTVKTTTYRINRWTGNIKEQELSS